MVQEVHHNDLTAALAAPVAVLDFNATWCGPCKMLGDGRQGRLFRH